MTSEAMAKTSPQRSGGGPPNMFRIDSKIAKNRTAHETIPVPKSMSWIRHTMRRVGVESLELGESIDDGAYGFDFMFFVNQFSAKHGCDENACRSTLTADLANLTMRTK